MKKAWKMHFSAPSQWNEMCFVHQRIIFQGEKGQHFLALAEEEEDIWKGVAEGWLTRCLSKQTKYKFRKSSDSHCHAIQMFSTFQWQRSEHCCKLVPIMSKNQSLMGLMTANWWACKMTVRIQDEVTLSSKLAVESFYNDLLFFLAQCEMRSIVLSHQVVEEMEWTIPCSGFSESTHGHGIFCAV